MGVGARAGNRGEGKTTRSWVAVPGACKAQIINYKGKRPGWLVETSRPNIDLLA